jgi:oligopeptide transport system substrate-binding protein
MVTMRWLFPVLLLATLSLGGCSKGGFSARAQAGKENVFRYPIVTNPTTLDPGMVEDGDTIDLLHQVYETLVTYGDDNRVRPLLAERWEVSPDGKTYTFHLKKGVKFHNGQEMTAEDVKWTYERNCHPDFPSPTAIVYLQEVVGVQERVEGKADEIRGIRVVGSHSIEIEIDKPRPYFIGKLTFIVNAVLPKGSPNREIGKAEEMVGTGPFKAERYVPDQVAILAAHSEYHGGPPSIAHIERPVIKDAAARLNKFKSGELDLVMLERQDVPGIQKDPELSQKLQFFPRAAIWYIGMFESVYPPFKDRRVRRAVAMAIDKEKLVNELLGGQNTIANSIVPPGIPGHREDAQAIEMNVDEARRLLAEAGYPNGRGLPPLELTFREQRPDIRIVAEGVASQLKQNLGMDIRLQQLEWRSFLERVKKPDIQFVHMRWGADYLDPENFLSFMLMTYPLSGENRLGYSNGEFDRLCQEADTLMDEGKRLELYARAEDIVLQDAPWVPIYFQRDAELISPRVKGLRKSLFGHLPHTNVRLED